MLLAPSELVQGLVGIVVVTPCLEGPVRGLCLFGPPSELVPGGLPGQGCLVEREGVQSFLVSWRVPRGLHGLDLLLPDSVLYLLGDAVGYV